MIKKILISLVLIVAVAVGAVVYYFDSLVKTGIETAGTQTLSTNVAVGSVSLSPLSGSGSIEGIVIDNPEGWEADTIFELGGVSVQLDPGSVMGEVVEIDSIVIDSPVITYETRITTDNVRDLISNIPGSGSGASSETEQGPGRQIIIRDLQLLQPRVNLVSALGSAPVSLPDLRLQNIGEQGNAATVADAMRQVMSAISQSILSSELPNLDQIREQAEERLQQEVENLENRAEEAIEDATEEIGNTLRSILN